MARLGVNIDHVATLRQARGGAEPDPLAAAIMIEAAGADGIVVHLREDRRHIQDRDVKLLRQIIQTKLDLEIAASEEMVKVAVELKPDIVTLVPERREERTTEGGLNVAAHRETLASLTELLHDAGIIVSLFVEPEMDQIKAAHKVTTDYVEIHTGRYALARHTKEQEQEFEKINQAVKMASKLGLGVNAGHGLTYRNIKRLTKIPEIVEFNIGHSIISRAVFIGLERAVREMKGLVS